ncbi:MAG: glycerol-3-phosphate dehydrogenase/oxidase, partial [Ketobacteraceae bacterium]|nr:glycerol-3-phosphate dehydrogenase/oxidase [Ketobacteraceae bacterium]
LMFNGLLKVYDSLAGIKTADYFDKKDLLRRVPGLNDKGLKGASYYTDAITDDARLVLRVLEEAIAAGGESGNYLAVEDLLRDGDNHVCGAVIRNTETGENAQVKAKVVINATGAWVDFLREKVSGQRTIRPLRGSHIVLPHHLAPVHDALTLFHPEDKRPVFVFPWEGATIIGTTDLDHNEDLNLEPRISQDELDYLMAVAHSQFPDSGITRAHIISTWAGVRPVISTDRTKDPSKEKRDHSVWVDKGLVSVSGGKLTTFRLIALDTLKAAKPFLGSQVKPAVSDSVITPARVTPRDIPDADPAWARRMIGRYGDAAREMLRNAPEEETRTIGTTLFCLAEIRWAARHEAVVHLDDLLLRRTRLGSLLPQGGEEILDAVGTICREELGWSEQTWQTEKQRYLDLWKQYYSLPDTRQ